MTRTISYSEVTLKRRCSRAHYYRYKRRLKRRRPFREPLIGTILHEMLHEFVLMKGNDRYDGPSPWGVFEKHREEHEALFREEQEKFGDIPTMIAAIFQGYLRRWRGDGLKYEASEVEFRTELMRGVELLFKIDKIAVQKSSLRFIMDHKFHGTIPDAEDRFADIQTLLYFWGYNREHRKPDQADGVLWDYGRMKAPTVPELLKSGKGLSKAKKIDTDEYTYLQAIRANGLNPKDYTDMLRSLRGKERTFFERVPLPAPPKRLVAEVVNDVRITAEHIRTDKDAPRDGMSPFNCRRCEFRSLCEAELRGHDTKLLLRRDYVDRDEEKPDGSKSKRDAKP